MERVFKPTDEMMSEFKPWNEQTEPTNTLWSRAVMADIIAKCMSDCTEDNTQTLFKDFVGQLRMLGICGRDMARYSTWRNYKDSDDGLVWLYPSANYDQSELETNVMDVAETLAIIAKTTKCDGYFSEGSNWFDFRDEIKGKLNYISDIFEDAELAAIANKLESAELDPDKDFDDFGELKAKTGEPEPGNGQDNLS